MRLMIVPAAGRGSRLGGTTAKVLAPVAGKPMIDHLLARYDSVVSRFILVVHPDVEPAIAAHTAARGGRVELALQPEPTGMLDAILIPHARIAALAPDTVWVTWCDQIAVSAATVRELEQCSDELRAESMALPIVRRRNPYTHLERGDPGGRISRVLQRREGDAMPEIGESEMGLFALSRAAYVHALPEFARATGALPSDTPRLVGTATGERNFLPFIPWLARRGEVRTFPCANEIEAIGVNTPQELRQIEEHLTRT